MKCTIPEISWHNREPVLSVDIFPEIGQSYKLASAGGDCHVLIWQMNITSTGAVTQELISDLKRHQKAVNCVRWSTTGKYLASADDDANIIIWQLKTDNIPLLEGDTGDKEIWNVFKIMRGHKEDVYDICWSIDEAKILSGSIDNTAILWDVNKGKMDHIMSDHKGFVQGVAWDPKNQFIATISTDRICRIFDTLGKHIKSRIQKGKLTSVPEGHFLKDREAKYFHDDTFKSFFRRLQFTPDGSLLIVPSGHIEVENCNPVNATLIFTLDNLSCPSIILPIPKQSSTVVRVCPVLYELHENGPDPVIKLPYRMVFAVGTDHDIILYDTQQTLPFARFRDIHYTRLTDLTWSLDGLLLIASSTDGFCSLITFELDELGVPWVKMESETEENPLEISGCEELDKDENVDTNNKDVKKMEDGKLEAKKRTSFLEQWALNTPKKRKIAGNDNKAIEDEVIEITESPMEEAVKMDVDKPKETINRLIPRRITPIPDKSTNSEQKINILVPKRIKPTFIEPLASTSKIKDRQDEEITKSDNEEESSESEVELSQEEQKDYNKASQNIKQLFSKKPQTLEKAALIDTTPTKEKVNVLIPRRVKRTCAESKAVEIDSTKSELKAENKESELIGKEIAELPNTSINNNSEDIGEKPLLVKTSKKEENEPTNAQPIAIRRKPRKSEAKSLVEETVANKDSDAKPIAVKRKSRDLKAKTDEESLIKNKMNLRGSKNDANKHSDAKPIAVKRKSRALERNNEKETSLSDPKVNLSAPDNKESLHTKPIAVKRKGRESKINKNKEKSKDENLIDKSSKKDSSKKPVFKLKLIPPNEKVDIKNDALINLVTSEEEVTVTTPKKLTTSKPTSAKKATPTGKPKPKSSNVTPRKQTTTLLNFLRKTETPPKTNKEEKVCKLEEVLDEAVAEEACENTARNLEEKSGDQGLLQETHNDEQEAKQLLTASEENNETKNDLAPPEANKEEKVLDDNDFESKLVCDFRLPLELLDEAYEEEQEAKRLKLLKASEASSDTKIDPPEAATEKKTFKLRKLLNDLPEETSDNEEKSEEKFYEQVFRNLSESIMNMDASRQEGVSDTKKNLVESKQEEIIDSTTNLAESTQAIPKTPRRVPLVTLASPSSKTRRKL